MGSRAVNILMVDRIEIEQAQYASRVQNGGITSNMKREAVANWEFLNARKALIDAALLKDGENVKVPKSLGDIAPTAYTNLWRTIFPDNNATVPPYRTAKPALSISMMKLRNPSRKPNGNRTLFLCIVARLPLMQSWSKKMEK